MMGALIRKELRALRPWAALSVCIASTEVVDALVRQTDMQPLSSGWHSLGEPNGIGMWCVAYAIGTGTVTREQDDGTMAFLDGLPVSRTRVFAVKCALICSLLSIAPCLFLASALAQHALSHGSLDAALRLDILLRLFALQLAAIVHGVLVGAAMGMLRSLTWLVTATITTLLVIVAERVPRSALLNPLAIVKVQVTGAGLIVDPEALYVQLGIALLAGLIAWWGFERSSRPANNLNLSKRPVVGGMVTGLTLIALLVALGVWSVRSEAAKEKPAARAPGAAEPPRFASSPPAQTATEHYRFAYTAHEAKQALALAAQADEVFERVHALIGVAPGDSIDVDTSGSMRNTEGTAYFGRVRIALNDHAARVLAHETSHVVAQRLAGKQRDWLWRAAQVLNEGLATYVEQQWQAASADQDSVAAQQAALASDRLLLAALYTRNELLVPEIADYRLLASMRDEDLKYPIGAALISATVKLYGPEAISRLVRAFANDKLPTDLQGVVLMDTVFQVAGLDFAAVLAELFRQVADDAKSLAPELATLARPRVRLVRRGNAVGVQAIVDAQDTGEPASRVHLRFKPRRDSGFEQYDHDLALGDEPVWRAASEVQLAEICVQAGLRLAAGRVLFEAWTCLPTAEAATWQEDAKP